MTERTNIVTIGGDPLTLVGPELKVGDKAPDFTALDTELKPKTLADYQGKVLVVSVVPSLDTPICDLQTRRFNTEAANLGGDVTILTLSMDLPFAQARWCGAAEADQVVTLSDHRDASFGTGWGLLIKELRLLARAVYVVDRKGTVVHAQIVPEVKTEPDYEAVLAAVKKAV